MIKFEKVSYEQFVEGLKKCEFHLSEAEMQSLYGNIKLPKRATMDSAGYDFFSPIDFDIVEHHYQYKTIPTGIRFVTDDMNIFLMCVPRSGLGFKYGMSLRNTTGIIDAGYQFSDNEGHITARLEAEEFTHIEKGKAFMQGIILPYYKTDDDNSTEIRNGGFGSTDKK